MYIIHITSEQHQRLSTKIFVEKLLRENSVYVKDTISKKFNFNEASLFVIILH